MSIRVEQRATLHLTPPTLLETSPSSFTNILPSLTKLHLSPKPVTITFVSFAVSCLTSIPQLPSCTIATSIVHSKLDYCNSHYYKLSKSQLLSRLKHIQNYIARTVAKASMSCHITPILRSLHWLIINKRIEYKLLSLTYKVLTTTQPPYLHNLISTRRTRSTRSSSVVTLARPPSSPSLKLTDRPFRNASPCLWNQLPLSFRLPHSGTSSSISNSPIFSPITSSFFDSPLCSSITPSFFHSQFKTYMLYKSYPRSFTFILLPQVLLNNKLDDKLFKTLSMQKIN